MSEDRIDILIADKGGKIGEVVAKSLRRHGLRVEVFDDTQVRNDKPGYIRNLKRAIETWRPEMVIPIFKAGWLAEAIIKRQGAPAQPRESKHGDAAQARHGRPFGRTMPCPMFQWPAESMAQALDILDDKVKCSGLAERLGIPQPRMYEDSQIENIQHWPVVYKRATGLSGSSVYFPKNKKALENLLRSSGKPHLVMDYIEGYDISVDIIRWPLSDGTVFCEAAAYRVLWPKEKGISKIRVGINRPEVIAHAKRILEAIDYKGVCGMDFRVESSSGKAYFLECNPRFSGGIKSALAAGLDLPFLLWQLSKGENPGKIKLRHHRFSIG